MLSWLSYNDHQLFAQFYHVKVVFQKASSKEPELCCVVLWLVSGGKAELSHVKGTALSQEPDSLPSDQYRKLATLEEVGKFSVRSFQGDPMKIPSEIKKQSFFCGR